MDIDFSASGRTLLSAFTDTAAKVITSQAPSPTIPASNPANLAGSGQPGADNSGLDMTWVILALVVLVLVFFMLRG